MCEDSHDSIPSAARSIEALKHFRAVEVNIDHDPNALPVISSLSFQTFAVAG